MSVSDIKLVMDLRRELFGELDDKTIESVRAGLIHIVRKGSPDSKEALDLLKTLPTQDHRMASGG